MLEQVEEKVSLKTQIPAKCVECPFLDEEHDPFTQVTRLYCRVPWWHVKRWSCPLPSEVARA